VGAVRKFKLMDEHWDLVRPRAYLKYDKGELNGWTATWHDDGRKEFAGQYEADHREGFCCLFNDDTDNALRLVQHCTADKVDAVHLISAEFAVTSFQDVEQAENDATARRELQEIDSIDSKLKGMKKYFHEGFTQWRKEVKENRGKAASSLSVQKRGSILGGIHEQNAENAARMGGFIQSHSQ
jgi:hypothetical protein